MTVKEKHEVITLINNAANKGDTNEALSILEKYKYDLEWEDYYALCKKIIETATLKIKQI